MIAGVQIIGLLFGLFMLYLTMLYFKRKDISKKEASVWCIIWLAFLVLILLPQITNRFLDSIGISRAMDFFTIFGFMFVFAIVLKIYDLSRKNQNKLERVVREITFGKNEK